MLNDTLTAFEHIDEAAAASPLLVEGSGSSGYRKLDLRISAAGLVSCEVDVGWAAHQSATDLTAAFGEALVKAKADLATKAEAPDSLDKLLAEALGLLNDPSRLTES
jgi:hypothetical protein